ncbi:DUF1127 domain-containing protein [Methylobacterium sp. J-072]|uniref:DUF1127 domain-containing protein n=1 Tax=Methylobacterium sp. J-072 TaxID=2836651 RepID=UPI001FBB97E1|nr:DUF1127 domain-containing protein [Methylobacterium sp. J-072]MCJ2092277.1 DUF1127 domain-containing protein [Methylobacterium sp. J-072]
MDQCLTETAHAAGRPSWLARSIQAIAEAAAEVRTGLSRVAMNRRVLHRLSTLSARELKDIGLTPQDVADAGVPGRHDAIALLVGRRDARRRGRGVGDWPSA